LPHRLIIEADGGQHNESRQDALRTAALERWGWRVIRFWNYDVLLSTDSVQQVILAALMEDVR
jgi:very-short-patch-repair endonuclease